MSVPSNINQANVEAHLNATFGIKETQESAEAAAVSIEFARQDANKDAERFERESETNPIVVARKESLKPKKATKKEVKRVDESILVRKEDADGLAGEFSGRQGNREYHLDIRLLSRLAEQIGLEINEGDSPEKIISTVRDIMSVNGKKPDAVIIDKAFEFLLEAARSQFGKVEGPDKKRLEVIYQKLETAKLKHFGDYAVDIEVGHKIIGVADLSLQKNQTLSIDDTIDFYRNAVHDVTANVPKVRGSYPTYASLKRGMEITFGIASKEIKGLNLERGHQKQLIDIIRIYQTIEGGYSVARNGIKDTMKPYLESTGIFARAA